MTLSQNEQITFAFMYWLTPQKKLHAAISNKNLVLTAFLKHLWQKLKMPGFRLEGGLQDSYLNWFCVNLKRIGHLELHVFFKKARGGRSRNLSLSVIIRVI